MNKLLKNILLSIFVIMVVSCTKDEKFEGTPTAPNSNQVVETVKGTIVSNTSLALPGQLIDFTFTLPIDFIQKIDQDVKVEVKTRTLGNSTRIVSVDLPRGQNVGTGKVLIGGGGGTYDMKVELFLNAIALSKPFPGSYFQLTSDKVLVDSGSTGVPSEDDSRLQIRVGWESGETANFINSKIYRVNSTAITLKGKSFTLINKVRIIGAGPTQTYDIGLVTTLEAAADKFVNDWKSSILTNHSTITNVRSSGKAIIFDFNSGIPPTINFLIPATQGNIDIISGPAFTNAEFASNGSLENSRTMNILSFQPKGNGVLESNSGLFNLGDYRVTIQPKIVSPAFYGKDLKYRVIIRKPNGDVLLYVGTYAIPAIPPSIFAERTVLTFSKIGLGETADYINFNFTP